MGGGVFNDPPAGKSLTDDRVHIFAQLIMFVKLATGQTSW
jgi:hypothetical protein